MPERWVGEVSVTHCWVISCDGNISVTIRNVDKPAATGLSNATQVHPSQLTNP